MSYNPLLITRYKLLVSILFVVNFFLLFAGLSLHAEKQLPKTYFLNSASLKITKILPPPPADEQSKHKDKTLLKDAMAACTKKQVERASSVVSDNVFDYTQVLGPNFNSKQLPLTAALFSKIENDSKVAIQTAKNSFARDRPTTWKKMRDNEKNEIYSYPSGHTTRAFLWATLLKDLFPQQHKELMRQARQKAWNRVILGRHYPDDVYAGQLYGQYLAKQFLKNPKFQQEWAGVKNEVKNVPMEQNTPYPLLPMSP